MMWDGLTHHWWLLTADGPLACSSDLAGLWHDDGARAVFFGTYEEAASIVVQPAAAPEPIGDSLFTEAA
jgi:hypothetical protein